MNITTREMRDQDLDSVSELFDLYRQFYEQSPNIGLARAFLAERFARGESVILVAEGAQLGVVGFCQLYPSFCSVVAQPIYVLYDLFVLPSARQMGAGRMLLVAAETKTLAEGKARMDLTTAKSNLPAQALYESQGWLRDDVFSAYSKDVPATPQGRRSDFEQFLRLVPDAPAADGDTLVP